jgi:hypothetical protein
MAGGSKGSTVKHKLIAKLGTIATLAMVIGVGKGWH